jgi:hypothetical protein
MPDPASPADSIERFAELVALEDDGDIPRPSILSATGVTAEAWRQIEGDWMKRLAAGDDPDLALRFATTYALARRSLSRRAPPEPPGEEPRHAAPDDDTIVEPAPAVGGDLGAGGSEPPAEHTTDELAVTDDTPAPAPLTGAEVRLPLDPADATLICPLEAVPKEPLPFVLPVPPPGKRLAFFDTQTGERLATPVLIDAPQEG